MNKLWLLVVPLLASVIPLFCPDCGEETRRFWTRKLLPLIDCLNWLIDRNARFMAPLIEIFRPTNGGGSQMTKSGPFQLPKCLKNPLSSEKLERYKHLAILGAVFDVSSNPQVYGPKGIYASLTGRDATRMLVSEGMSDAEAGVYALDGLTSAQLYELGDWFKLYSRKYTCIGHLPGVYWSPMGDASEMLLDLVKAWNGQPPEMEDLMDLLPPCNSFFDGKVLRLTCSLYSGGESGRYYPRQLLEPEKAKMRCACVPESHLTMARLRFYPGCDGMADQCLVEIGDAESVWTGRLTSLEAI